MPSSSFSFDSSRPIYMQIVDHIYNKIAAGELKHGDKLDSVRELAYTAGVNPNTVQRAYMEMERSGVVEIKRGQGTFVAMKPSAVHTLKKWKSEQHAAIYIENMQKLGFNDEEIVQFIKDLLHERRGGS